MAFERFLEHFTRDPQPSTANNRVLEDDTSGLATFFRCIGGTSYAGGLYRTLQTTDRHVWRERLSNAFPEFERRIECFAFDWLGRAFTTDTGRIEQGLPGVLMFEPGTGEVLEIPANIYSFHDLELLTSAEAALAVSGYHDWMANGGTKPTYTECVGYRKPLFLGGADNRSNLQISDIDVYWSLMGQLIRKVKHLPPGTPVKITLD